MSKAERSPRRTGRARRKQTRLVVKLSDVIARVLISVGGIGTIVAVCLVFVFLAWVVVPLFRSPALTDVSQAAADWTAGDPLQIGIDEYRCMGWSLHADGTLRVVRLDTGEPIATRQLFAAGRITAASFTAGAADLALGFDDGTVRLGRIDFEAEFRGPRDMPSAQQTLAVGALATLDESVVQRTPQGQFRLQKVVAQLREPIRVAESAILALDHIAPEENEALIGGSEYVCCALAAAGEFKYCRLSEKQNLFTGVASLESELADLPRTQAAAPVVGVLLAGRGENVYVVRRDGGFLRYDTRVPQSAAIVERLNLLATGGGPPPSAGGEVTAADFVLGRETVIVGDSRGGVRAWFRCRVEPARGSADGFAMAMVHELPPATAAVTALGASQRSRMVGVGYADGNVRVFHVTTNQLLVEQRLAGGGPIAFVAMAPKDDGVFAAAAGQVWSATMQPGHPEATLASLFRPVWYEGHSEPRHIWQSSFAGVAPEMKLGLVPIVFGTLKATVYSMLFGAPVALLAAIYTSEFLHPRAKGRIKPLIEMMASLPSVVLGFLAASVFAPIVEHIVPSVLASFATIPLAFLVAAQLWQLLPQRLTLRLEGFRFWLMCLTLPFGLVAAWLAGPLVERWLFAGEMRLWLDGQIGGGAGAWMFLLLPLCGLAVLALVTGVVNGWLRSRAALLGRGGLALLNLAKLLAGVTAVFLLATALSTGLDRLGWDPRGTFVGTYVQRNALVVGFVMGFAIIPIIYTIADDALATVPNHLRSGSLACGATPWQTTWRVVIPTAMSGLFSALMIGLGRAVGETMIVLMAAGNTPIMDWNLFNGFRTLASNIAVELPEAVRDSTHYRTLFLAALTLFLLTFVINTFAELVRLRFRQRAYQL